MGHNPSQTSPNPELELWGGGGLLACLANTASSPASLVPCPQDTCRGLNEGKATQLCPPWLVHDRTGDKAGKRLLQRKKS